MRLRSVILAAACGLSLCAAADSPEMLKLDGDISGVHDPVIAREGDTYYVFATGGSIRRSKDLHHWTQMGRVFERMPEWTAQEIPGSRGYWAPDISRHQGTWRLYYAVSTFGKNDSAIGLATNKTLDPDSPDYKWVDQGMVLRSHHDDDFNAIDPNLAVDAEGRHWLNFGSFWSGIKMRRIDPATGKLWADDPKTYSLSSRAPKSKAVEAPFIVSRNGWYYLFVSFDTCCRGAASTYNVVVGRAKQITGPYADAAGTPMMEGGGTRVTYGTTLWHGPGHEGVLLQSGGPDLMVFHAYDGTNGRPFLHISTILWTGGWPRVADLPGDKL